MDSSIFYYALSAVGIIFILFIARALVWWYFGIYEFLDRLDKNNNLLTDIRELLKQSTGIKIKESNIKNKY